MYEPTSEQIQSAEGSLQSWQRAMTTARAEILSHEPDLLKAGVSQDQINQASNFASERAKSESELKQKEDPLAQIANAIRNSAQDPQENLVADASLQDIERVRMEWQDYVRNTKAAAEMSGKQFKLQDILDPYNQRGRLPSTIRDQSVAFPVLDIYIDQTLSNREIIAPSDNQRETLLKSLGVLKSDQKIADLMQLAQTRTPKIGPGPIYDTFAKQAKGLSTNIPGVSLNVSFTDSKFISATLDISAFGKAVALPRQ